MERGQIGKASETEQGDWIEIQSRNPNQRRENDRISRGFHLFDVVVGKKPSAQPNNPSVLLFFHGSISGNTVVKKTGSNLDH